MGTCGIEIRIALLTVQPGYMGQKSRMAKFNIYEWKQSINFMALFL